MRILVVEDDAGVRRLLESLLREETDHTVLTAANGKEALALLEREPIQLIVTDWMMEEMDGLELIRRIRSSPASDYIFIIVITAKERKSDVITALQAGADDCLTKPFDLQELQARIASGERRVRLEQQLRQSRDEALARSQRDSLTGVLNRDAIMSIAESTLVDARRFGTPFCVALLDFDNFKKVNDQYGHLVGDELLRLLTKTMYQTLRAGDWIGRWGGDEFLIVLTNTDLAGGYAAAERMRRLLLMTTYQLPDGEAISVDACIGVAMAAGDDYPPVNLLLQRADEALYGAKDSGKNQVVGWPPHEDPVP